MRTILVFGLLIVFFDKIVFHWSWSGAFTHVGKFAILYSFIWVLICSFVKDGDYE